MKTCRWWGGKGTISFALAVSITLLWGSSPSTARAAASDKSVASDAGGRAPDEEPRDFGDAPEGALAYPDSGIQGRFPTCVNVEPAGAIRHMNFGAFFGNLIDLESEGNAGNCPWFNPNQYDRDECFGDGDAGLILPGSFTIQGPVGGEVVVSCPNSPTTALGRACQLAVWGQNVDILVANFMPNYAPAYVNVLMDWNRDGLWGGASLCGSDDTPEHVLVNFLVPFGFFGPLSQLGPPPFRIGPTSGWVWVRFTISEQPVQRGWDGSGDFEDGETEDYLLHVEEQQEEPEACSKWHQEPDCEFGMDLYSFASWDGQGHPPQGLVSLLQVADDWISDGRPIMAIRWWGSYPGHPENQPPQADLPDGFILRWWTDVPTNISGEAYSMPGVELTNVVGWIYEPRMPRVTHRIVCTSDLSFVSQGMVEYIYEYELRLPSPWMEKEGHVYWLSVEAFYNESRSIKYRWGWTTGLPWRNWNGDATGRQGAMPWEELTYPPLWPPWNTYPIPQHPYAGISVNMAFALLTDVCPARCKKWSQMPDMATGTDMWSWRHATGTGGGPGARNYQIRADDFISDGRPITDIHWWGSYSNWMSFMASSLTNPVPPPSGVLRPLGFDLSWHLSQQTPCVPGTLLTNLFVPIHKCHEVYYGCVTQWWVHPEYYEHEYQYYVDLLDPEVSGQPWYELEGTHYWINIQAVFTNTFEPSGDPRSHGGWGWKTAPSVRGCPSVVSNTIPPGSGWQVGIRLPPHPSPGPFDLAFELTTVELPATNSPWYLPVRFTNMQEQVGGPRLLMISTGHCGCGKQVLQTSTNLLVTNGWSDLWTNPLPRDVNFWIHRSSETQRFYRIKTTP